MLEKNPNVCADLSGLLDGPVALDAYFARQRAYVDQLEAELADTMAMCGAHSLADISRSMLYGF